MMPTLSAGERRRKCASIFTTLAIAQQYIHECARIPVAKQTYDFVFVSGQVPPCDRDE